MRLVKKIRKSWDHFESRVTKGFTPFQKKLWNVLVFLARFCILAIPFHIILWSNFDAYMLQVFVASAVSYILSASGVEALHAGTFVYVREPALMTVEIIKDCVGWKSFLAFAGLVFAVRGVRPKNRIAAVAVGAPVFFFANIFRIFTSVYASLVFGVETFDTIHGILWQGGMMALIVGSWIVWLRAVQPKM